MTTHARTHVISGGYTSDTISFETVLGGFRVYLPTPNSAVVEFEYHDAMKVADWMVAKRAALNAPPQVERYTIWPTDDDWFRICDDGAGGGRTVAERMSRKDAEMIAAALNGHAAPTDAQPQAEQPAGELLPCPFCGGEATMQWLSADWNAVQCAVQCMLCGAHGVKSKLKTESVAAWNRRAAQAEASVGAPHSDPADCPLYYDGCHCTAETLSADLALADAQVARIREAAGIACLVLAGSATLLKDSEYYASAAEAVDAKNALRAALDAAPVAVNLLAASLTHLVSEIRSARNIDDDGSGPWALMEDFETALAQAEEVLRRFPTTVDDDDARDVVESALDAAPAPVEPTWDDVTAGIAQTTGIPQGEIEDALRRHGGSGPATVEPIAGLRPIGWWHYDPTDDFNTHDTADSAEAAAQEALRRDRADAASDGEWSHWDQTEQVCWGAILGAVRESDDDDGPLYEMVSERAVTPAPVEPVPAGLVAAVRELFAARAELANGPTGPDTTGPEGWPADQRRMLKRESDALARVEAMLAGEGGEGGQWLSPDSAPLGSVIVVKTNKGRILAAQMHTTNGWCYRPDETFAIPVHTEHTPSYRPGAESEFAIGWMHITQPEAHGQWLPAGEVPTKSQPAAEMWWALMPNGEYRFVRLDYCLRHPDGHKGARWHPATPPPPPADTTEGE